MFKDIFKREDVKYIRFSIPVNFIIRVYGIFRILRPFIRRYITDMKMDSEEEMIFVYYNPWGDFLAKSGCIKLLREKYKKSIHIVLLYDVFGARKLDMQLLKNNYDDIYIYDQKEAEAMQISYFPPSYSKNFPMPSEKNEIYDVAFAGQAKDRLAEIMKIYKKLTAAGLKCHFYIVGADDDFHENGEGLIYGKRFLSENEYFDSYISPSKCLLEITNAGIDALTARVREAVMYDKKILSNNTNLKEYKYYREDMMQVYDDVDKINIDFFKMEKHSYHYEGDFSPVHLLDELNHKYTELYKNSKRE